MASANTSICSSRWRVPEYRYCSPPIVIYERPACDSDDQDCKALSSDSEATAAVSSRTPIPASIGTRRRGQRKNAIAAIVPSSASCGPRDIVQNTPAAMHQGVARHHVGPCLSRAAWWACIAHGNNPTNIRLLLIGWLVGPSARRKPQRGSVSLCAEPRWFNARLTTFTFETDSLTTHNEMTTH